LDFSGTIKQEIPMKRSSYTETQIVKILKETEAGVAVEELSRQHGFSISAFYKWKADTVPWMRLP
jgi:putative transposase